MAPFNSAPLRSTKSAKAIAKRKAILKVKSAIRWHERAREKRLEMMTDRYDAKTSRRSWQDWTLKHVKRPIKRSLQCVREDWKMGPLRPNRAYGYYSYRYGALEHDAISLFSVPTDVIKRENERRERRGEEPQYPLVVDNKKYFPIAEGDRVVVMSGREKGKIGTVVSIQDNHMVTVNGINKSYIDDAFYGNPETDATKKTRINDIPVPIDNLRLVIPYRITTAEGRYIYQDVLVDKIVMERHTTGIDPFTGVDYGSEEFPAEHRFDPETELPLFKRYIAGTRIVISWPWEKDEEKLKNKDESRSETQASEKPGMLTRIRRLPKDISERIASRRNAEARAEEKRLAREAEELSLIDSDIAHAQQGTSVSAVRSWAQKNLKTHDDDTARNRTDPTDEALRNFYPTLVYPPFPQSLTGELKPLITEKRKEALEAAQEEERAARASMDGPQERQLSPKQIRDMEKKREAREVMKTPLQLRWETMRAKQVAEKKEIDRDQLLLALGKHMEANGISLTAQRRKTAKAAQPDVE